MKSLSVFLCCALIALFSVSCSNGNADVSKATETVKAKLEETKILEQQLKALQEEKTPTPVLVCTFLIYISDAKDSFLSSPRVF